MKLNSIPFSSYFFLAVNHFILALCEDANCTFTIDKKQRVNYDKIYVKFIKPKASVDTSLTELGRTRSMSCVQDAEEHGESVL